MSRKDPTVKGNVCPAHHVTVTEKTPFFMKLHPHTPDTYEATRMGRHEPVEELSKLREATLQIITIASETGLHVCKHCGCLYWSKA